MNIDTYGFIGLGNMGGPLAGRLLDAGCPLEVFDRDEAAAARLAAQGATRRASAIELADSADTIFLSLPTPEIVRQVTLGADGLIHGKRVKRVVDLSTIGPRSAKAISQALAERGIVYVDAPVSGGVMGATRGTLAVMVACPRGHYDALESKLKQFGPVFYLGQEAGLGQSMKLANNLLSASALAITAEAMVMGVKSGLEPGVMLDVLNAGSGRNSATQDKFPKAVLPGTFDIGFAAQLAYKDVRLCVDESESIGVPMIVGAAVREMLVLTNALYGEAADFTDMVRLVESWGGVQVRQSSP
ncbi:NAD(P)-dependent oxidoreductase [Pollutimonas bauzanensis]|uniref:3-hydroxyisobutyrate dehydrogenase n=1 Tax=Pollutimonas bauzanensis TaxID=658167 RepID=A0A1M5ZTK6_9BURK|nr:NAD(P)-dependent oxidoreductase [Pollutimonas bauzanensis]SHI27607.1 3-hydroxyisobutyrate dehydrogenase [Pollutimonas bauzanensis]